MMRGRPVVAIDGPAAAGKSTAGKRLAAELGYLYIDTGALYRATALKAARLGIPLRDGIAVARMLAGTDLVFMRDARGMRILMDGEDLTEEIRGETNGLAASTVSALPEVRLALLGIQRRLGASGGIVMDGRDIGTVIFPDAEAKFFLDASPAERARRRCEEMRAAGRDCDPQTVMAEIRKRDLQDSTRDHAPLSRAPDALVIDTTATTPDEVVALMRKHLESLTS